MFLNQILMKVLSPKRVKELKRDYPSGERMLEAEAESPSFSVYGGKQGDE